MGSAEAVPRSNKFVIIKFISALHQVTLTVPTPPCEHGPPGCVWRLWVDEPFAPGRPVLGSVIGTSGVLTVTYPSTVCGTVQGDASVTRQVGAGEGGQTFRYQVGHRLTIPCTSTSFSPHPPTGIVQLSSRTPEPSTELPITGATSGSTTGPSTTAKAVTTAAAQLPFTGLDVRPLAMIGMALVLVGSLLATRLEQHQRMVRWLLGQ